MTLPLSLAELGLIDEYAIVGNSSIAGHGPTLFAGLSKLVDLKLVSRLEFVSGAMATKILNEFGRVRSQADLPKAAGVEPLTERETQVLELVVAGLSNSEIGDKLFLSENTIKKYLHNILEKLHLNNRVEAAIYAVREGLLKDKPPDEP